MDKSKYINKPLCNDCCHTPVYNKDYWDNLEDEILKYTNCYSYAFDRIEHGQDSKLQPGDLNNNRYRKYRCNDILSKIKDDHGNIIKTTNTEKIPCNYYKIALVIDNKGEHDDYHFYRKDTNGTWSHKQGKNPITNIDADGNIIYDPRYSSRNYDNVNNDKYNYEIFCGYYAVPYKGTYLNHNIYSSEDNE